MALMIKLNALNGRFLILNNSAEPPLEYIKSISKFSSIFFSLTEAKKYNSAISCQSQFPV